MTRTPDEIKKRLVEAVAEMFWATKYGDADDMRRVCGIAHASMADAFVLIQSLEKGATMDKNIIALNNRTLDEQAVYIDQLINRVHQLEAERDAAVADIKQMVHDPYEPCFCDYCKLTEEECAKSNCRGRDQFEWRGVQKEE